MKTINELLVSIKRVCKKRCCAICFVYTNVTLERWITKCFIMFTSIDKTSIYGFPNSTLPIIPPI